MKAFIFIGPTITPQEANLHLNAIYLPPVRQGDIYKLFIKEQPDVIGIIDGYFEQVPSVWHKEILWAMCKGTHILGSSSMGAIRASELDDFGMIGVGKAYDYFKGQLLTDDDEVALKHGPCELDYMALSEPMLNIRITLYKAFDENIINKEILDYLIQFTKSLYYGDRTYENIISQLGSYAPTTKAQLENWLPKNKINQKKQDAIYLLNLIKNSKNTFSKPADNDIYFEYTDAWDNFVNSYTG